MEDITHLVGHVLEHSIEDTLYLIPFLFVTYLAMEWLEHKAGDKAEEAVRRAGAAGPVVGAVVGIVPQCGFSAAAATLWAGRVITLGTLFAVFLSTSDEMLPIFLAEQVDPMTIVKIMGVKLMIGMIMGFVVDAAVRLARRDREKLRIHELCERDHCHCNDDCEACEQQPELAYDFEHDEEHEHHREGGSILRSALKHTVQVTVFIFVITLVLDGALELVGEDALAAFLGSNPVLSVLGSALDKPYPQENEPLMRRILESGGSVVSEYAPGPPPSRYSFLQRNRIIAGMCLGTLVTEGPRRSGALNTATRTLENGREVFALPGNVDSPGAQLPNMLISEGARLVTGAADILSALVIEPKDAPKAAQAAVAPMEAPAEKKPHIPGGLDETQRAICAALLAGEADFDALCAVSGLESDELGALLIEMEMDGLVTPLAGTRYAPGTQMTG